MHRAHDTGTMFRRRALRVPLVATNALDVLSLSSVAGVAVAGALLNTNASGASASSVCQQARVPLGASFNFRVRAGTTILNTGNSVVKGDTGLSPGSVVTGFPPGSITGLDYVADKAAAEGQSGRNAAYRNAMGRTRSCATLIAENQSGKALAPGL